MAELFKPIDTQNLDWNRSNWAQKTSSVRAEHVPANTPITTRMKDGHIETQNTSKEGDVLVTNPSGEQYLVGQEKFNARYDQRGDVFTPKAAPVEVMAIRENVSFKAPWGEEMKIKAGGVLVKAGENDVYGIQKEEFHETYDVLKVERGATKETATKAAEKTLAIKAAAMSKIQPPTQTAATSRENNQDQR